MSNSFRVAVLGPQNKDAYWFGQYGMEVFDLSVEQLCTLLEEPYDGQDRGINHAKFGALPGMTYQVMGGGRFSPMVSREEIARVMQGVQILVALLPSGPGAFFAHQMSQDFFQCLIEDNLMEKCILIARLTEQDKSKSSGNSGKIKAEALMKLAGLDPQKFSDRLYVIDPSKASKSKGKKKGRSHQKGMAELRASLMGEQLTEMVTQPVKETMSAGKALIGLGQRFTGWLGSLVKAN